MNKTTPKDFFLHLGATISLYIVAGYLINLAFSIIDYLNPDQLAGYFYGTSIVWSISMLIILVPLLYVLEWFIAREIKTMPEKRDLWIRRWRIYLTLFLAVILVAGDLISLINTYLSGEITARFVYKVIFILLVAGCVGKYYFFSLYPQFKLFGKTHVNWSKISIRFNAWFGIILVLATLITGFVIVGSPVKQRNIRFDKQRVSDLSSIQSSILYNYWQPKGVLPNTLDDLYDPLGYVTIPLDPQTNTPYEYKKISNDSFELCATFAESSEDTKGRGGFEGDYGVTPIMVPVASYPYPGPESYTWDHEAGLVCFKRTIDKERYPVTPKPL